MSKATDAARGVRARWSSLSTRGKLTIAAVLLFAGALAFYTFRNGVDALKFWNYGRKDAQLEKTIQQDLRQAEQHGANANNAEAQRQVYDQQYNEAQQRRAEAARTTARARQRTNDAQSNYEKTLHSRPADYAPAVSDDELCARLAKLDPPIPCRQ